MKKIMIPLLLSMSSISVAAGANVLFFQAAADASITKTAKNSYTLSVQNPTQYVTYFTDRPVRKSGLVALPEFLSLWTDQNRANNFAKNPPNVAINMVLAQGKEQNVVVEVSKPTYTNNTLNYQIRTLDNKSLDSGHLKHLVMFFDDIHWNPGGF
ncbi:hypothetical protein ACD661_01035 [Legionella lytica]|uniref:Uncharacterized protein n=1 Tax=Legionella lytica TaxID=96232 RepID=A0ABW8D599_9GAMM